MAIETPTSLLSVGVLLQYTLPAMAPAHPGCVETQPFPLRQDLQCCASLLGWKEGAFVISGLPYLDGSPVECRPGSPCVVRYMHDGKVVGYRSEIRGGQRSPEPLLFLSFPDRIEEILLRQHPRIPLHQPVSLMRDDPEAQAQSPFPEAPFTGVLRDLSVAGCRVALAGPCPALAAGTPLRLEFELPAVGHVANLAGIVKNVSGQPGRLLVGIAFQFYRTEYIEFRGWGGTVQKAIEQFVAQRQSCGPNQ